jgi:single-strand DNA-binding protein
MNKITISGGVVADPEYKTPTEKFRVLEFPLYDNETRKNKDTGEYEQTGNVTKLKVVLKNDLADQWRGKINKGDIVEIVGSITEREYDRKDGGKGRSLETTWVDSVTVKFTKSGAPSVESDPVF